MTANPRFRNNASGTRGFGRRAMSEGRRRGRRSRCRARSTPRGRPSAAADRDHAERGTADGEDRHERAEPVEIACRLLVLRLRHVPIAAYSARSTSGTLIRKATRQPMVSTSVPPMSSPSGPTAAVAAAQMPNARAPARSLEHRGVIADRRRASSAPAAPWKSARPPAARGWARARTGLTWHRTRRDR